MQNDRTRGRAVALLAGLGLVGAPLPETGFAASDAFVISCRFDGRDLGFTVRGEWSSREAKISFSDNTNRLAVAVGQPEKDELVLVVQELEGGISSERETGAYTLRLQARSFTYMYQLWSNAPSTLPVRVTESGSCTRAKRQSEPEPSS